MIVVRMHFARYPCDYAEIQKVMHVKVVRLWVRRMIERRTNRDAATGHAGIGGN